MKVRMEILQNRFQSIVVTMAGGLKNRCVLRDAAGISNPGGLAVMWWA